MDKMHEHKHNINLTFAFKTGIIINIVFIILEASFGFLSNSMALVADAGHNLSDVLALVFSWIAVNLSQRKPTLKFTYGFRRSTILTALLNTILLLVAVTFIIVETIKRIKDPAPIKSDSVIIIAAIGIIINGFTAWLFVKGKNHDLNIRSAFIHFVADALVSLGVVITGIIIALTGLAWVDSVISFIIAAIILFSAYHLLIDSVNLALDAVPDNINIQEVRTYLENIREVINVHDLHIWALSTTEAALTVHLAVNKQTDAIFIKNIQDNLKENFGIGHSTIQIEYGEISDACESNCN